MNEYLRNIIEQVAKEKGVEFDDAAARINLEIEAYFQKNSTESRYRTLKAADAAIAAVNRHFAQEVLDKEWVDLAVLQKSALSAALAAISVAY